MVSYRKLILLLLMLLCFEHLSLGQKQGTIDSLLKVLKTLKEDSAIVSLLYELFDEYTFLDIIKAHQYCQQGLTLSKKLDYQRGIAEGLGNTGSVYLYQSNYDRAMEYYLKSLDVYKRIGSKNEIARITGNIGIIYMNKGNYVEALKRFIESAKIREELGDKKGIAYQYNNIARIYYYMNNKNQSIEYLLKALKIAKEIGDKEMEANYLHNIGIFYYSENQPDTAIYYFNLALKIQKKLENKRGISEVLSGLGTIYIDTKKFPQALSYLQQSLEICKELNDKTGIIFTLINIGQIYFQQTDYSLSIEYYLQSLSIAKEIGSIDSEQSTCLLLAEVYSKINDYKNAFLYQQLYAQLKDTLFNNESQKALAEMGTKYETEKKEKQIEIQDLKITQQVMELNKKQIVIYAVLGGLILVLSLVVVIFRSYRLKKKAHEVITIKNEELGQANEEISAQRDEIEAQRDILSEKNTLLFEQKKGITDSINYAKRIQQAVLPSGNYANNILGDHFILFKPKDIVSGDFYWGTRVNEWLIVTVADCTGHGVPGAFMSMLGVSFLNEIIRKKEITKASEILDNLRESLIEALQQKGQTGEQKDGMDIVLCAINITSNELQFSGANNPLYIIRNSNLKPLDKKNILEEILPDKQPVGIYQNMKPFTNHVVQLNKGDCIYFCSDGYKDQFGGTKNKKFMAKQLKQLLTDNCLLTMKEQKEVLDTTFENWKGKHEQIDDVTILGLKI